MKRFLAALIMALAIHGLAFFLGVRWLNVFAPPPGPPQPVTIRLAAIKHSRPDQAPAVKKTEIAPRPPAVAPPARPAPPPRQPPPVTAPRSEKPPLRYKPKKSLKRLTRKKPTAVRVQPTPSDRPQSPSTEAPPVRASRQADKMAPATGPPSATSARTRSPAQNPAAAGTSKTSGQKAASPTAAVKIARPLYVKNATPRYPRRARKKGLEGTVVLEVLVDETGKVKDLKLLRSSGHAILDRAAAASVKKWLFAPGAVNGAPARMWVKVPIRFELN